MVAAAGEEGALAAGRAWALLGGALAVLLTVVLFAPFATDLGLAPLPKSPDALFDRAGELARKLGYSARPADTAFWWDRRVRLPPLSRPPQPLAPARSRARGRRASPVVVLVPAEPATR